MRRIVSFALAVCCAAVFLATRSTAQQPPTPAATHPPAKLRTNSQGIFLVFPFENVGSSPRLDWLGEGLEELTIQRLAASGQQVYSHAGRVSELDRYGLPSNAKFSHATMLHVGADLDADFVIFGKFSSDGTKLTAEAQLLRVNPTRLYPVVRETGPLDSLMELHDKIVWRLLSQNDPVYPLSLAEFTKAQLPLRLDAFEHYVRGLLAVDDDNRIRELREAAKLEPTWPDPAFALGEAYFSNRDCQSALPWLAQVPPTHERYVEAVFTSGVCRLILNEPEKAEEVFTALQASMKNNMVAGGDLPELLNDLALARSRQGKIPAAQDDFYRAVSLDPDEDDYPFNLGLMLLRNNDPGAAAAQFREATEREPDNPEDRALLIYALDRAGQKSEADQERANAADALGPAALPNVKPESLAKMDRVKTELDTTELHLEIESPESRVSVSVAGNSPSATPVTVSATAHNRRGRQLLAAGQLDQAETEFRAALAADPSSSVAHTGLAEVYRRHDKLDDAAKELQTSLALRDSAVVRTSLAKVYLEQKKPDLARDQLEKALKVAPNYVEAKQLLDHLSNGKPAGAMK